MHKHAHQPRLTRVVLVLVALAVAKVRALSYAPDQIRESRLKTANVSSTHSVRAAFVILARNSELHALRTTVGQLEDQFHARHNYPYVFLNNEPFTDEFKRAMEWATSGDCHVRLVPYKHWSVPSWVDNVRAKWAAATMDKHVP